MKKKAILAIGVIGLLLLSVPGLSALGMKSTGKIKSNDDDYYDISMESVSITTDKRVCFGEEKGCYIVVIKVKNRGTRVITGDIPLYLTLSRIRDDRETSLMFFDVTVKKHISDNFPLNPGYEFEMEIIFWFFKWDEKVKEGDELKVHIDHGPALLMNGIYGNYLEIDDPGYGSGNYNNIGYAVFPAKKSISPPTINDILVRFLENHPCLFLILQRLLKS